MVFNCPLGSYQFQVMLFRLQGVPAVFIQLINNVLHEHLYQGVLVYLDDILIYPTTMEEHTWLVQQVLRKLLVAKLYVKLSKCEFHQAHLDYLGYCISSTGVEMDPHKIQTVLEWQAPKTQFAKRQLQSFLGFGSFYRQFIPSVCSGGIALTDLLRTKHTLIKPQPGQPLQTIDCQQAFETLKALFASPETPRLQSLLSRLMPVMWQWEHPVAEKQGQMQPCAYTSCKLTETEHGWAIWEKEAFTVRSALLTWRHLLKEPFEVRTDHKNLEALQTPYRLSLKQVRWAQYCQWFCFTLKYIPAGKNFLADALPWMHQFNSQQEEVIHAIVPPSQQAAQVTVRGPIDGLTHDLQTALLVDPWL